jgi:hypothetical protein
MEAISARTASVVRRWRAAWARRQRVRYRIGKSPVDSRKRAAKAPGGRNTGETFRRSFLGRAEYSAPALDTVRRPRENASFAASGLRPTQRIAG